MNNQFNFTIANTFEALSSLCQQVHDLLSEQKVPAKKIYTAALALEEMITNTIKYGYEDNVVAQITVTIQLNSEIKLLIKDNGHQFNPLENKPKNLSAGLAERQIGGMGIHLTKTMVKSMSYSRADAMNILTIIL